MTMRSRYTGVSFSTCCSHRRRLPQLLHCALLRTSSVWCHVPYAVVEGEHAAPHLLHHALNLDGNFLDDDLQPAAGRQVRHKVSGVGAHSRSQARMRRGAPEPKRLCKAILCSGQQRSWQARDVALDWMASRTLSIGTSTILSTTFSTCSTESTAHHPETRS